MRPGPALLALLGAAALSPAGAQVPGLTVTLQVEFTSDRAKMGEFTNSRATIVVAWITTAMILGLNAEFVFLLLRG